MLQIDFFICCHFNQTPPRKLWYLAYEMTTHVRSIVHDLSTIDVITLQN